MGSCGYPKEMPYLVFPEAVLKDRWAFVGQQGVGEAGLCRRRREPSIKARAGVTYACWGPQWLRSGGVCRAGSWS